MYKKENNILKNCHPGYFTVKVSPIFESFEEAVNYIENGGTATVNGKRLNFDQLYELIEKSSYKFYLEYAPKRSKQLEIL